MQNLVHSFPVGMVSISADPRHLTEEKFIIYLINNSSCTSLTLSDLKMTALPSFSTATLGTRHSKPYKRHGLNEHIFIHPQRPRTAFVVININTQDTLHISSGSWRGINQSCCFSYLNGFCLTPYRLSFCSCTSSSLLFSTLPTPHCPVPLSSISMPV